MTKTPYVILTQANRSSSVALSALIILICTCCSAPKGTENREGNNVIVAGEMRRVMQTGDLSASINLDSIQNKDHLFGVGPLDSLKGEITILDGKAYSSSLTDGEVTVREGFQIRAPFFVYTNVNSWEELPLPDSVTNEVQLDDFITTIGRQRSSPFAFRLTTLIDSANIHVVNLPEGTVINSPADTHIGQKDLTLTNSPVEIVGFFSTSHQGVFTHHGSNIHMHLITVDSKTMGHVDQLRFKASTILYIQK